MERTGRKISAGVQNTMSHVSRLSTKTKTKYSDDNVRLHETPDVKPDNIEMTPSRDESPDRQSVTSETTTEDKCPSWISLSLTRLSKLISPDGRQDKVRCSTIWKGIIARVLFLLHSFSMARSVQPFLPHQDTYYIPWSILTFLMICEIVISYTLRQFSQWKW